MHGMNNAPSKTNSRIDRENISGCDEVFSSVVAEKVAKETSLIDYIYTKYKGIYVISQIMLTSQCLSFLDFVIFIFLIFI